MKRAILFILLLLSLISFASAAVLTGSTAENNYVGGGVAANRYGLAQSFTISGANTTYTTTTINFKAFKFTGATGTVRVGITQMSGGFTDENYLCSETVNINTWGTGTAYTAANTETVSCVTTLTNGTQYALYYDTSQATGANLGFNVQTTDVYSGGNFARNESGTWTNWAFDGYFQINGDAASTQYLEVTAFDSYTGAAINSFNASINGTFYNTTTGVITTDINKNSASGTINISINATNYFSRTYTNQAVTTDLSAQLHQSEITFYAYNRVTGTEVTTFTATTTNNTATATNPTLNLSVGTYTATFSKNNYYPTTTTFTTTALETSNKNFSVYDHQLNTTINVVGGSSTDQNFTIDIYSLNYSFYERIITTNGEAIANLTPGTYTVYLNDSIHTLEAVNITLNSTSNYTALTIDVYTTNAINFNFRDEETDDLINGTVTVYLTGDIQSYNYATNNGTLFVELLAPQSYVITYSAPNYNQREYAFTLTNRTFNELTLYLLNTTTADLITITVQDLVGSTVSNATVKTQRKNLSGTNYYTVQTCTTGSDGTCVQSLILYDVTYRFIVEYEGAVIKTTTDQKVNSVSVILSVDLNNDLLGEVEQILGVTGIITWTNSTSTFTHTWNQNSGLAVTGCIKVIRQNGGTFTTVNSSCSPTDTASGSYSMVIDRSTGDSFRAVGYVLVNSYESITDSLTISFRDIADGFGKGGLYLIGFFVIGTMALIGLGSGVAGPIIMVVAGLGLFTFIGFINLGVGVIGGLLVIGIGFMVMKQ